MPREREHLIRLHHLLGRLAQQGVVPLCCGRNLLSGVRVELTTGTRVAQTRDHRPGAPGGSFAGRDAPVDCAGVQEPLLE